MKRSYQNLFGWDVASRPVYNEFGEMINGYQELVRNDNEATLNITGERYSPIPNSMFCSVLDSFAKLGCEVTKYGAMANGKKIYAQLSHDEMASAVIPNDHHGKTKGYATLVNSHDGSSAFKIFVTVIRMYCNNQFHYVNNNASNGIRIKHTVNYEAKINDLVDCIDNIVVAQKDVLHKMQEMSETKSFDRVTDYVETLHKLEEKPRPIKQRNEKTGTFDTVGWTPPQFSTQGINIMKDYDSIWDSYKHEMNYSNWGLFNATTHYVDHEKSANKGNAYSLFGTGMELKGRAFKLLTN